jgi:hypothetical protein
MYNVKFHNLCRSSNTGLSKNSGKMCRECRMDGSAVSLKRFLIGKWGRRESIQRHCVNIGGYY